MSFQKPHLWAAENCALVYVDSFGAFSDRMELPLLANWGHGDFPVPFGLPVFARFVQAATSWSDRRVSLAFSSRGCPVA